MSAPHLLTDLALARRLERAEGAASAAFVDARARLQPGSGAEWREVDGAFAMFDGVDSPLTQTFALGMDAAPTAAQLAALEAFFAERGAAVHHEVSPLADPSHLALLAARGYVPVEVTSVLRQPLPAAGAEAPEPAGVRVRRIAPGEEPLWADTSARGWSETPALEAFMRDFGLVSAHAAGTVCFLAEVDGVPAGAAALALQGGVALLAGASTDPAWRGRGAQGALLRARLRYAAEQGCDLAMMGAQPGSASQRNAERQGFRIAYTRLKWARRDGAGD